MLSERNDGASISEVCGIYLGNVMKNVMRVFSVVLLVMVGTGNIHECSFHDLFLLCRRVSGTFYEGCLSGRNYLSSSIPWNLYPCDKETNESIVVRQRNLNI